MVVRTQSHRERHTAAGLRTAPADRRSSAQPVEWIGLWSSRTTAGCRDDHHATPSADRSDDCDRAIANSATADRRRRGGRWSIGNCRAERFLPRCIRFVNVHTDTDEHIRDRRHIRRRVYNSFGNRGFGRTRCRDLIGVGDYFDDSTWNS